MAETLVERCYYLLQALNLEVREIFEKKLSHRISNYPSIVGLLDELLRSSELNPSQDAVLIDRIRKFLGYGADWEKVYSELDKTRLNQSTFLEVLDNIVRLLGQKLVKKPVDLRIALDAKLSSGMQFFRVIIPGYSSNIELKLPSISASLASPPFRVRVEKGDSRTYLHNPTREGLVFKKEHLISERFPEYLVPLMRKSGLTLYLCSVETMLGHLAQRYGKNGVLNIVAVSKKKYITRLDDRTLFVILERNGSEYVPLEFCFGGILHRVPLISMQTLAFVAGLRPDEISLAYINDEFEKVEEKNAYGIEEPLRVAFIGWWHEGFKTVFELYLAQNLRRALAEFVFYLAEFLPGKDIKEESSIFSVASKSGFSLDAAITSGRVNTGLRTRFYDFLQTRYGEGFVEESKDYIIDILAGVASLASFDPDPAKNEELIGEEIDSLTSGLSGSLYERRLAYFRKTREISHGRKAVFSKEQYLFIKSQLLKVDSVYKQHSEKLVRSGLENFMNHDFVVDVGRLRAQVFRGVPGQPIEFQAGQLVRAGFKTLVFYGTAGGIIAEKIGVPAESLAIPEVIFTHPRKFVIDPSGYVEIPVMNVLVSEKGRLNYFNTDNFYKTHSIFVASQFQEHVGFLRSVLSRFTKHVTVEMDLAPLAELCVEKGVGLGAILFVTDELSGVNQRLYLKGYYMRQLFLSLFRGYEGRKLFLEGLPVEEALNPLFAKVLDKALRNILASS